MLLGSWEQAPHHERDFGARKSSGGGFGQRMVAQSVSQPSDRADERPAKLLVGAVCALHETAGPKRVKWIALAGEEIPFDLVRDGCRGFCHFSRLAPHATVARSAYS
jgi:hypothetical protein